MCVCVWCCMYIVSPCMCSYRYKQRPEIPVDVSHWSVLVLLDCLTSLLWRSVCLSASKDHRFTLPPLAFHVVVTCWAQAFMPVCHILLLIEWSPQPPSVVLLNSILACVDSPVKGLSFICHKDSRHSSLCSRDLAVMHTAVQSRKRVRLLGMFMVWFVFILVINFWPNSKADVSGMWTLNSMYILRKECKTFCSLTQPFSSL